LINRQQPSTLRDYLQIARRRLWIILTVTVLTVLGVAFFSARQEKLYQGSAKVLVSGFDSSQPPDRFLQTQADIATASPEVARRVRSALGLRTTPPISVTPKIDSDILTFSSTAVSPRLAARVATMYAQRLPTRACNSGHQASPAECRSRNRRLRQRRRQPGPHALPQSAR
jgi:uncharacterized protein involved in exopolysaccharide biosynthesis